MIELLSLTKKFNEKIVLDHIDLTIYDTQITYIIGSSGTGKSVLVKHIVGLLEPDEGKVIIDGIDTTGFTEEQWRQIRKRYVMVFQQSTLFDSMTLRENVALPLRLHNRLSHKEALEKAEEYLKMVGMDSRADLMPSDVGPSERKRVSLARALTLSPACAILDEPTTGLDPIAAANVDSMIMHLGRTLGRTAIVVSHDLRSTFSVADRVIFLYKGRVRLDGPPSSFKESEDQVVQQFIRGEPTGPMET